MGMNDHPCIPYAALPAYDEATQIARAAAFSAQLKTRRTCRHFSDRPVPRVVIEEALLAAGSAPSGANHQPWHFAVIGSADKKSALREAAEAEERAFYSGKASQEWLDALAPLGTDSDKPYLETAPWLIVIFGQRRGGLYPDDEAQNYYVNESVGIATGFLIATLHEAGLAMKFLNRLCNRPANEKPVMVLVVGHAAPDATVPVHATIKKPLDQISSWL
jgi:iodotyrosine deiodinase